MKVNRTNKLIFFIISMIVSAAFLYNAAPALSNDDLFLNGIVKNVNPNLMLVKVDVKSLGCKGEIELKAEKEDISLLHESIGKEISFFIDSSTCSKHKTYNMKQLRIKVSKGR